jgi:hypothetical protein
MTAWSFASGRYRSRWWTEGAEVREGRCSELSGGPASGSGLVERHGDPARVRMRVPLDQRRVRYHGNHNILRSPTTRPLDVVVEWYRIPDARDSRVMRPSLGRLSTFESRWVAWCDAIRVLIRVLQPGAFRSTSPRLVKNAWIPHDHLSPLDDLGREIGRSRWIFERGADFVGGADLLPRPAPSRPAWPRRG